MPKQNCWEIMNCGREPGGKNVDQLGACRVPLSGVGDGFNGGQHRGRICWAVTGTFCLGEVQGIYAQKRESCSTCLAFKKIKEEEGTNFQMLLPGQEEIVRNQNKS